MQQDQLRRIGRVLVASAVFLLISLAGLRYAYYSIFSVFRFYDDEGTQMLRVSTLVENPGAYDSIAGPYGPFYYLYKYALHGWLHLPITHDVTRLTTIVLWALIAVACAIFVYRLSRSIILAAVVQMQLILQLGELVSEPGHPQEIALLLVSFALLASSFVIHRRGSLPGMIALGAATGALLLVKLNVGIFLAASVALAILFSLPRNALMIGLTWTFAAGGVMLPAALMWRHLDTAWGRNYCAFVTLVIGASLVAAVRSTEGNELRWRQVAIISAAAAFTVISVCVVILAWGNPLSAIANSIFLRAANFTSIRVIPAPIPETVVAASLTSFLLAMCYALYAPQIRQHDGWRLVVASIKLVYGCFAFYSLFQSGPQLLLQSIPLPFLWFVVVRTDAETSDLRLFPRVLLCLLAAYQILQAYPLYATQSTWTVYLVAPLAAICVADGWYTILKTAERHWQWDAGRCLRHRLLPSLSALLLIFAGAVYYRKADVAGLEAAYRRNAPLALPGASKLRFFPPRVVELHSLIDHIKTSCDGFVGMPGVGSLYFWTQIAPPAAINGAWILNLEEPYQRSIVEKMRTYERPCVVYNPKYLRSYLRNRPLDQRQPLVEYIQQNFMAGPQIGGYTLLLGGERAGMRRE
jgi:hypothetical protein